MKIARLILGWGGVLATLQCGPQAQREPLLPDIQTEARPVASARPAILLTAAEPTPGVPVAAASVAKADVPVAALGLQRFDSALRQLSAGRRDRPVRVAWFGDSHTAADFLTGEVRRRLQSRFGVVGPGFLHVGNLQMRHDDVRVEVSGKWRVRPTAPAGYRPAGDVQAGLSGVATVAEPGAKARIVLPKTTQALHWELVFNAPRGRASFEVVVGSAPPQRVRIEGDSVSPEQVRIRRSGLLALAFDTQAPDNSMQLQNFVGDPEFYGVFVEGSGPGVVVDTYGINGARIRTPLSWVSEGFVGELAEREPELVVLAYGTNEAGDNAPAETYRAYYEQVLQRIRAGAPEADCLLVGPTDRQNSEGQPIRRVAELDAFQRGMAADAGCAYFSLFTTMGGSGGFANWMHDHPQLAASDGVHLTISGYQRLGGEMTDALLLGWDAAAEGSSAEL